MSPIVSMVATGLVALVGGSGAALVAGLFSRTGRRAEAATELTRGASEMTDRVFKIADRESAEAIEIRSGYRRLGRALSSLIDANERILDALPASAESRALRAATSIARAAFLEFP